LVPFAARLAAVFFATFADFLGLLPAIVFTPETLLAGRLISRLWHFG
jgi:hypothetical protein